MSRGKSWSQEEDEYLRSTYTSGPKEALLTFLNRSWQAIKSRASTLGLTAVSYETWTKEELVLLSKYWPTQQHNELKELLPNRSWVSIRTKASRLGLKNVQYWTKIEDELLKQVFSETDLQEVENLFPRWDLEAIKRRAYVLRLTRNVTRRWTKSETSYLKAKFLTSSISEMSKALGRSTRSVKARMKHLGLTKLLRWNVEEEEILKKHYYGLGQTKLLKRLPGRTWTAISAHASQMGLTRKRNLFQGEYVLRTILDKIYPNERYINRTRPMWLTNPKTGRRLELDRYYPDLGIAFEYNGEQHYEAVYIHENSSEADVEREKKRVQKRRSLDRLKKKLCKECKVQLVVVSYKDELSVKGIREVIFEQIGERTCV